MSRRKMSKKKSKKLMRKTNKVRSINHSIGYRGGLTL